MKIALFSGLLPGHVCPWWIGWALASPLRRIFYKPHAILQPYVREGMIVLEPGPGMGFFTLELARLVGSRGKVVVSDIQPRMLDGLRLRAQKHGLISRIDYRLADSSGMHLDDMKGKVDFVLAFAMVHEVTEKAAFFKELLAALASKGKLLISEPAWHVKDADFKRTLETAQSVGLKVESALTIRTNHSAVLCRHEG
jgi:ubiquinone/menaquinone biosynthesis C-methylase UbiE